MCLKAFVPKLTLVFQIPAFGYVVGVQIPPQGVWKPRVTNLRKYNWWMAHGSVTSTIIFVLQDWVILNQDDVIFRLGQV